MTCRITGINASQCVCRWSLLEHKLLLIIHEAILQSFGALAIFRFAVAGFTLELLVQKSCPVGCLAFSFSFFLPFWLAASLSLSLSLPLCVCCFCFKASCLFSIKTHLVTIIKASMSCLAFGFVSPAKDWFLLVDSKSFLCAGSKHFCSCRLNIVSSNSLSGIPFRFGLGSISAISTGIIKPWPNKFTL